MNWLTLNFIFLWYILGPYVTLCHTFFSLNLKTIPFILVKYYFLWMKPIHGCFENDYSCFLSSYHNFENDCTFYPSLGKLPFSTMATTSQLSQLFIGSVSLSFRHIPYSSFLSLIVLFPLLFPHNVILECKWTELSIVSHAEWWRRASGRGAKEKVQSPCLRGCKCLEK